MHTDPGVSSSRFQKIGQMNSVKGMSDLKRNIQGDFFDLVLAYEESIEEPGEKKKTANIIYILPIFIILLITTFIFM